MKRCRICGELKAVEEFHRAKGMRDGRRNECKACFRVLAKARYDSATAVTRTTKWRKDNPERFAAYQAEYRNRPERRRVMRDLYYRRTYGLSAEDVDAMLAAQGNVCVICDERPEVEARMHVDHDHVTGELRGVLCSRCNQAIGLLREDPALLARAAAYLRGR